MPSRPGYAWTRYDLGLLARRRSDFDTAARCLRDGLTLFREIDYGWAIGRCAWALAAVCLRRSEIDEAAALLAEALDRHEEVGDGRGLAQCLESAAALAGARGEAGRRGAVARRRGRAAAPARRPAPRRRPRRSRHGRAGRADGARTDPGRPLVGRRPEHAGGRRRRRWPARAVDAPAPAGRPAAPRRASPLTGRERQVADLVAAGRTNRQIGRALGIAEKTVEVHVHHVIAKLGAQSRAEVAAWVAGRQHAPLHGSPDTAGPAAATR